MVRDFKKSPLAFKASLDARIRNRSTERGTTVARERMRLIFERFLARIHREFEDVATLKGGLALELRLAQARTTKDVDLRMTGSPVEILLRLQEATRLRLDDFLEFEVGIHPEHEDMTGDGVKYDGVRFRVECMLAGRRYGDPFGLDVAVGDPIVGEPEIIQGSDLLEFIGVAAPSIRVYPVETHIAEKLHAYTMPRRTPNSRVKDLPDLALLGLVGPLEAARVWRALEQTFRFRDTHAVPPALPEPAEAWARPYRRLADENRLRWPDLAQVTAAARALLDPVLRRDAVGRWSPASWAWEDVAET